VDLCLCRFGFKNNDHNLLNSATSFNFICHPELVEGSLEILRKESGR
jgi:hypothetical protein